MPAPAYLTVKDKSRVAMPTGPFTQGNVDNIYQKSYEDAFFTYRNITWFHEVVGTSGSNKWRTPKTS